MLGWNGGGGDAESKSLRGGWASVSQASESQSCGKGLSFTIIA